MERYLYIPDYIKNEEKDHIKIDAKKKWQKTLAMRENLNVFNFEDTLNNFIVLNEGIRQTPYFDTRGFLTVGIGFLIGKEKSFLRKNAEQTFKEATGECLETELKKNGKIKINQAYKVLKYQLDEKRKRIKSRLPFFEELSMNEKISLESLFFNAEVLLGKKITDHLKNYHLTKGLESLEKVVYEIEQNSNLKSHDDFLGIQYRRDREGVMASNLILDSFIRKV
jgi:hypothetical protein